MRRILGTCASLALLLSGSSAGDPPPSPPPVDDPKVWIHAPAEDLLPLKGAGFMITVEEYRKLLELAKANDAAAREKPPIAGRLVRGECVARIDGEVLRIAAKYTAVVQGDGVVEIPFRVEGAALEKIANLRGDVLTFDKPGTYEVLAVISARLAREGDLLRAAFRLPPAAGHTVALELPPEVEGEVGPIVRAFRSDAAGGRVVGYPDETGLFQLWLKPLSPARRLDALLGASFETVAEVGEARTGLRSTISLSILRAPVDGVDLLLAPGQTVRALDGKNVKTWQVAKGAAEDVIEVKFTEPLQEAVVLTLETDLPRDRVETAALPVVRVRGAVRYRGTVAVVARPEVRIEGLSATGVRRLEGAQALAIYEVWSETAGITATVKRLEARAEARTRALLSFREGGKTFQASYGIDITGDPLFRLEPTLPRGWLVRRVVLDGADAPYTYEPDGRLVLEFPEGLKPGRHSLFVAMDTDEVDWVPNEGAVAFELAQVRAGLPNETGLLVVASDPAFRVNLGTVQGLTAVGMDEAARAFGGASDRMLFAWRYEQPGFATTFALERHAPQIAATVVTHLLPSERLLATGATVLLDIQRTGVREIRVSLPKGTGPLVDFAGPMIKEKRAPSADADPETWTIVFQRRVRGAYRLDVSFDRKFDADAWSAATPGIAVPDAQERGFVVIHSSGTTEISVKREGLREADVGELPEQPERPPLEVLAYAQHPYRVEISSRRHDPEPVVQAIAVSADIYGVVTPDGRIRCRAEYLVRNNDQPFLRMALPEGSDLLGALAAGEPIKPLREGGELKLPLPRSKDRETPFRVVVVYETQARELDATGEITIGRPSLDVEVLETTYRLHLPDGYKVTGFDGDLVPMDVKERESVLSQFAGTVVRSGGAAGDAAGPILSDARLTGSVTRDQVQELRQQIEEQLEARQAELRVHPNTPAQEDNTYQQSAESNLLELVRGLEHGVAFEEVNRRRGDEWRLSQQAKDNVQTYAFVVQQAKELGLEVPVLVPLPAPTTPAAPPPAAETARAPEESKSATRGPGWKDKKSNAEVEKVEQAEELADVDNDKEAEQAAAPKPERPRRGDDVLAKGGAGGGAGGADGDRAEDRGSVAHGGPGGGGRETPPPGGEAEGKRARPERALLSLDIQFLRPQNLCQLRSLAPGGSVTLSYARSDTYDRQGYMGAVVGAAAAIAFVLGAKRRLLFLLPGALLLLLSLHFAGLSFLPADFAMGAATALVAVSMAVLLVRLARRVARIRWRKAPAAAAVLLVAAAAARAEDQVLVPYGKEPGKVDRVFLPADEYHRLRKLAYPETAGGATVIADAQYEAAVEGGQLTVRARYEIAKETDEAERIPLALRGIAMTGALLDGKPATLAIEDFCYVLVLEGKGRRVLELELRPKLRTEGDAFSFAMDVRPVATARLALKHDLPGYDAKVAALGGAAQQIHALGPVGVVACTFAPRVEPFRAKEAELRAETATVASVRDGFTGVAARVRYGISGGSVSRVRMRVGRDLTVLSVACKDLAGWEIDGDGNLVAALAKPADRALVIEVRAERKAARERTEPLPDIAPLDVLRDAGLVAIETLPDLKIRPASRGLMQARLEDVPADLRGAADAGVVQSAYRYAVRPFELSWQVSLEESRLTAEAGVDLYLDRDRALAEATLRVTANGPGPFTLSLPVPAGYEVTGVSGDLRDWWVRDGTLLLDRATRLQGTQEYRIVLRRVGSTAEPFAAPALALAGAARQSGLVRLAVADGLEAQVRESSALSPEDIARAGGVRWGKLVLAFRYDATPWRLEVSAREEPREVDAIVVSRIVPLADRIFVEALINFHVRRGLVDGYSFVVPVAEEHEALVAATDRREIRSEGASGARRFFVTLRTPTRGSAALTVSYSVPYGTEVKGVEPLGAGTVTRYVAVEKAPDGEVRVARAANLDPADFADLPLRAPETTAQSVARVFVGAGAPFALGLDVRRHAFEEVAKAVVYRALATAVVDRSGWTRVGVSYKVYNRSEQFMRVALPKDTRLLSVLVAGEGVRPLAEGCDLLVPLRKLALGSAAFDVDVIYAYQDEGVGKGDSLVKLPSVKGLDVRRTALVLRVPKGFAYDFETKMEKSNEARMLADEATDLYQQYKDISDVAQRGNRLQAGRALANAQQVETETRRLFELVRKKSGKEGTIQQQVESQERALATLSDANRAQQIEPQQGYIEDTTVVGRRGAVAWEANEAFMDRARDEERKQVDEFKAKKAQVAQGLAAEDQSLEGTIYKGGQYRGPSGGVPPGLRDPSDPEPPPEPPADAAKAPQLLAAGLFDVETGKALDNQEATIFVGEAVQVLRSVDLPSPTLKYGDAMNKTVGLSTGGGGKYGTDLSSATGRISLRIALPTDGDVYYFSKLGGAEGVSFDADAKGRGFLHGALAVLFAALAAFLLMKH